jgi:hypothetical protein
MSGIEGVYALGTSLGPFVCANDCIDESAVNRKIIVKMTRFMMPSQKEFMATPLSFLMVKTGGFASPDFSGFAPCVMVHTIATYFSNSKLTNLILTSGTSGNAIRWTVEIRG